MGGEKKNKGWRRGRRTTATQPVQMTRHLIICEGKQTEPLYFEGMKKALGAVNGRKLAVVVRGTAGTLWTCWIVRWIAAAMRQRPTTMFGLFLTGMTFLRLTLTSWSANALSSQILQGPFTRSGPIHALSSGRFCI